MSTLGGNFLKCWWHHRFRTLYQQDAHPYYFTSGYSWQQRLNWGVRASNNRKKVFCRSYNNIVPNGQNHFQNIILRTILIFFFDSFSWASVNSSDRYYRKTDQWSHWAVDREVKVETRLMLNNFFHSVKCPVKMRISLLQNKLFCLQGNWRNLMTWQENPVLQCHSKSTRNLINLKEGDIKHQITQKKILSSRSVALTTKATGGSMVSRVKI